MNYAIEELTEPRFPRTIHGRSIVPAHEPCRADALPDSDVTNRFTSVSGVRAARVQPRPWIKDFPVCETLSHYQIAHVGIQQGSAPIWTRRAPHATTYFLACFSGRGRVMTEGPWRNCEQGHACLLPAHTLNAVEALPGAPWEYCWVCYERTDEQPPLAGFDAPAVRKFDPLPLRLAILGLMCECGGAARPDLMQDWTDLIHSYVLRFARSYEQPDRLQALWGRVGSHLSEEWTLDRLSRESGYSREHLRRICHRQLGRSPMHHVTYLRMRQAARMLATSDCTIESIARDVGYQNPFAFSNAFTRCIGWRPSEYRRKNAVGN